MNLNILGKYIFLISIMLVFTGCATAISKNTRALAEKEIRFEEIKKTPDNYKGKIVVLGGDIIKVSNFREYTQIELLEKPADYLLKPRDTDRSGGRFMVVFNDYLDPAIYTKGRQLTVAGEIIGQKKGPLGEIEYVYPLLEAIEIHLWPERKRDDYPYPYTYYYPVHFHWWYHPYWRY